MDAGLKSLTGLKRKLDSFRGDLRSLRRKTYTRWGQVSIHWSASKSSPSGSV